MGVAHNGNDSDKIEISQRRYLGSKTKLLDFIDEIIQDQNISFKVFAEVFAGTGVVAYKYFEQSDVIVNDILESNYQAYVAYFGKTPLNINRLRSIIDKYNALEPKSLLENYFSINFADTYFDRENSLKIGAIREDIENLFNSGVINKRERAYLITSLIYALDRIAHTVGHYDAYRKTEIPKKKLVLKGLDIKKTENKSYIYKKDANELVKSICADIIYIDPPYNSRQYSDSYHLLENIAEWEKDPVHGVAKKIDRTHIKSKYNLKTAAEAFSDLINNIEAKYILVSYNDMGGSGDVRSQAKITDHEIVSALKRRGAVKVYEKKFKQFTTGKSNNADLKERIFFCRVSNKLNTDSVSFGSSTTGKLKKPVKSPLNYTGGKYRLFPQIQEYFPKDINTFYDVFCGGANVGINAPGKKVKCLDINQTIIDLLNLIQNTNFEELHQKILSTIHDYSLSQSYLHGYESYGVDSSKGLGSFNKDKYLILRDDYNKEKNNKRKTILLLVLILYSFNNQIRFNSKGEYNLPVGKRDYNGNSRKNIALFNKVANEKSISFDVGDFRDLKEININRSDFVYLDPPYLLGLATYNENGGWTEEDELELYEILDQLDKSDIRFALSNVSEHKGNSNIILHNWVKSKNYKMNILNYDYRNSNYQSTAKNNKTTEVLITNY